LTGCRSPRPDHDRRGEPRLMTIVSIVHSYRIAPAEILEKLVVPSAELNDVLARLHAEPAIDEVVLLSTATE
jgi:glutamyl-tRNA reductase